ncbi:hypothetical protein Adeg_0752 [Ammonifex degensii KC4]|uniref:CobQ/CobB/MinD/ParA nucleotide binding domain-containing protein n=1 Tax=Ammonifex degensii (strain DSM 10501 / KC4) TaxID=429009 RepID=C9RCC1_AMMDK|nr:hypothetical protein Adeg_0752 [Ammonifex degensii KC4]
MQLQRLVINADSEMLARVARISGLECLPLNGSAPPPGSAVVVLRPPGGGSEDEVLNAVRSAAALGVPVVVIAGGRDPVEQALLREAALCGVPGECVLLVDAGKVVDATGAVVADALRGKGIGVVAVVRAAERALRENLVPEPALWEEGAPAGEEVLWEEGGRPGEVAAGVSAPEAPTGQPVRTDAPAQRSPVGAFFDLAGAVVAVFGVKSGVGATTVAACLTGVLADHGGFHLEVAGQPTGYVYYGGSPLQAASTGRYACFDGSRLTGDARRVGVLVADVSLTELADVAYGRAGCTVFVADGSPVSFKRVQSLLRGGWRCDVLVVNRVVPGAGYPPEVYAGEFGFSRVVGVPGGLDEEAAVNQAQHAGTLPLGRPHEGAGGEALRRPGGEGEGGEAGPQPAPPGLRRVRLRRRVLPGDGGRPGDGGLALRQGGLRLLPG